MDASRAMQALNDGDWHGLALALADRSLAVLSPEGSARFTIVAIGRVGVRVTDWPGQVEPRIEVHAHTDTEGAATCFERSVNGVQEGRRDALSAGIGAGTMYVDGVLTPAPEGSAMNPFEAMLAQLRGVTTVVRVPDDPRDLDSSI